MQQLAISIKDGKGITRFFALQYITALYPSHAREPIAFYLDTVSSGGENGVGFYFDSPEDMHKEFDRVKGLFCAFHGIEASEEE